MNESSVSTGQIGGLAVENKNSLRVYHKEKHDDFTVTVVKTIKSPETWIYHIKNIGGFWHDGVFTPWHSISHIEIEYE